MRRFLRWLVGVEVIQSERLDELDDSFAHLERRFIRLQQQFTRLVRELPTLDDDDEDGDDPQIDWVKERAARG